MYAEICFQKKKKIYIYIWSKSGKCFLPAGHVMLRGSRPEMSGCLGKRWMTGAKRKWFRSLFQILNQPLLRATAADLNCGTCDFLFPAQIMIVWTTGALAPRPLEPQEEELVVGSNESVDGNRNNVLTDSEFSQAKTNTFSVQVQVLLLMWSCTYQCFMGQQKGRMSVCKCVKVVDYADEKIKYLQFPSALLSIVVSFSLFLV